MKKIIIKRLNQTICIIICLSLLISFISTNALSGKIRDSKYVADLDTMDTYQEALINGNNGARYAGRVWSDKSVFLNDITLDDATDGYKGKITNNSDFLNAFSALGSSLRIIQPVQLDFRFYGKNWK